ncbi:DUF1214 domain-containing protein [Gordonia sp. LSe1-13]|uniref:DUF1214 domain-containing protein n=1 Tax=Gordonia sesuvii TaxID=3116777 RepID=A0ABU7MJ46_9ACTN|nr:DUF1214 domain-containing protein [Gordonia sp. LSe1-13]
MTGAAPDRPEVAAWDDFVESLRTAGEQMATDTAGLDPAEQADGYRALLRGVANQLGRFEIDRERPELVPFNGWRQKFLMDNPDFRYWVADIRADRRYRIRGNRGDAVFVSVTTYARTQGLDAEATARLDSDVISFDAAGNFEVTLGGTAPPQGDWLTLSDRTTVLWVRFFHEDVDADRLGECTIEPLDDPGPTAPPDPGRFAAQLGRMGAATQFLPRIFTTSAASDQDPPNEIRHWSEMAGGSVFTEPDIHYLRGGWQLEDGEALVVEGDLVACRYWNILAYSRFLNSLDYRSRRVSYTGRTATVTDGRYRFTLSARPPASAAGDWIDTEGRSFGIVVMRFLAPTETPALPRVRRVRLDELETDQ